MAKGLRNVNFLMAAACAALMVQPVFAGVNLWPHCTPSKCGGEKPKLFDATAQTLIWELSHNPALMNIEYLKFYIGRPENEEMNAGSQRHYYWYDGQRQPAYELIQYEVPGQSTESTFIVRLDGMGVTFDALDKFYGNCSRRFYDYSGHPNELFTFAPNTFVSFGSPPNSFMLSQAKILYRGEPLPEPPADAMAAAQAAMIARAQAPGKGAKQADSELIPLLAARVKTNPYDAEGHLLLGQALQRTAHIHEALGEYKMALQLSGDNQQVQNQALDALRSMHLIDVPESETRRNLEIVDNGQRIRVVGKEKQGKKQNDPPSATATLPNGTTN